MDAFTETFTESFFSDIPDYPNAHNVPLPFEPMPKNKTACEKEMKKYMAGLPFDEPLNTSVLRWIALWNDKPIAYAQHFTKEHVGNGYVLIAHVYIYDEQKEINFSFRPSIQKWYGNPDYHLFASQYAKHLNSAMRQEIQYQIDEWRRNNGNLPKMDVDHIYPFVALVRDFLRIEGAMMRYGDGWNDEALNEHDELAIVEFDDGTPETFYRHTLRDRALAARWRAYHQKHARLQWMTKKENSSKGAKILDDVII